MNFLPKDYDPERAWKVSAHFEHPDFVTHANDLHFMSECSTNFKLICNLKINKSSLLNKKIYQKVKLLALTLENLVEEKNNIEKYPEYSVVCVSWVPVKSYYLVFNLLILLEYLATANDISLSLSHSALFKNFRTMLKNRDFVFDKEIFNQICTAKEVASWKIPPSENVRRNAADPGLRYKQIIKKLALYSSDEFKRTKKIKRLSGEYKKEFEKTKINLCEFLYWYRIKANYRDMEFVDKGVAVSDFVDFYNDYYNLSMNFYSAMKHCVNDLANKRTGEILIN